MYASSAYQYSIIQISPRRWKLIRALGNLEGSLSEWEFVPGGRSYSTHGQAVLELLLLQQKQKQHLSR